MLFHTNNILLVCYYVSICIDNILLTYCPNDPFMNAHVSNLTMRAILCFALPQPHFHSIKWVYRLDKIYNVSVNYIQNAKFIWGKGRAFNVLLITTSIAEAEYLLCMLNYFACLIWTWNNMVTSHAVPSRWDKNNIKIYALNIKEDTTPLLCNTMLFLVSSGYLRQLACSLIINCPTMHYFGNPRHLSQW